MILFRQPGLFYMYNAAQLCKWSPNDNGLLLFNFGLKTRFPHVKLVEAKYLTTHHNFQV